MAKKLFVGLCFLVPEGFADVPITAADGSAELEKVLEENVAMLRRDLAVMKAKMKSQRASIDSLHQQMDATGRLDRRLQANSQSFMTKAEWNKQVSSMHTAMDTEWMILCGALVMIMHAGFAMLEAGCCRVKNTQNVLMKNLVNVCVGTLGWWIFGWAFAYGSGKDGKLDNGFIGYEQFAGSGFLSDADAGVITVNTGGKLTSPALNWYFQWTFCTAGATIVSGGVAERVKSASYALFAFVMASFIYPVIVAWTWGGGWLSDLFDVGFMDFAGSGIVHLTGGISALAGTICLGAREGRWERPDEFEAHSLPLVVLGTFILWFGWFGFNPGSTLAMHDKYTAALAAQVAMNTTVAAATGGLVVFAIRYKLTHRYDVGGLCNGILAGLVSITAGCSTVETGSAFTIALLGGFFYQAASMLLQRLKIDDPVDAVPVHGGCGIWGVISAAIFDWGKGFDHFHGWGGLDCIKDDNGSCIENGAWKALGANVVLILCVIAWSGTLSSLTFLFLKKTKLLRIDQETEDMGLDMKHHSPPRAYVLEAAGVASPAKDFQAATDRVVI
eukprot:TRINITY_DN17304_c0_g1_i1.p1 TRINITY_DN17304_c0_g1~~TRINITY_DN17304_c0_g1_i1.p1  ORF type:complete len:558 (+),score=124.49 TRINITY_DN17304_c0_g1_i1:81-1754(+)